MHFSLLIMKAHYINIYDCSFLRGGGGGHFSLLIMKAHYINIYDCS